MIAPFVDVRVDVMRRVVDDRFDDFSNSMVLFKKWSAPNAGTVSGSGHRRVGQHDDRHFRIGFLERFEQLDAALTGQADIENDGVGFRR
jgi:hypothetical protein